MILTKKNIFGAEDISTFKVDVPEWGGEVFIKEFSLKERVEIEQTAKKGKDEDIFYLTLVKGLCDEKGTLLFDEKDIPMLSEKNNKVLHKLFKKCLDVNKISEDSIETSEKN